MTRYQETALKTKKSNSTDLLSALKNRHIKEIIDKHPLVGDILGEYDIGCVNCNVGTCLLNDIVEYHYLPEDRKQEMWQRIADAVSSGASRTDRGNKGTTVFPAKKKQFTYSPPLKKLVDEHGLIKRWLGLIPAVMADFDMESAADRQMILEGINFIRNYADRYHHAKEEDILFEYFDQTQDIFRVMHEDHKIARAHVKAMLAALERLDRETLAEHLDRYADLLNEHIKKEDEILYPWMDRQLTDRQIGELFQRFTDIDLEYEADGIPRRYERFIEKLEREYNLEGRWTAWIHTVSNVPVHECSGSKKKTNPQQRN